MGIIITSVTCFISGYFLGKSDYNKKLFNLNLRLKDLENRCYKLSNKLYEILNAK